jgi:hypothetical protein
MISVDIVSVIFSRLLLGSGSTDFQKTELLFLFFFFFGGFKVADSSYS